MNHKDIVKHFYEVVVSENLFHEIPQYIAKDYMQKIGENEIFIGVEGMQQHLMAVKTIYPDYAMKIGRQFEDGDTVISEFVMSGTLSGEFMGITPTNKVIKITGVDISKVVDGKIVEHGGAANTFEAFWENGLIKPV